MYVLSLSKLLFCLGNMFLSIVYHDLLAHIVIGLVTALLVSMVVIYLVMYCYLVRRKKRLNEGMYNVRNKSEVIYVKEFPRTTEVGIYYILY